MNAPVRILVGLETEFGVTRDTGPGEELDVVAESIAVVRAAACGGVRMRWDYRCEDPHRDTRGFRVDALRQDTDESGYVEQDAARPLTFAEIKSDRALPNGARLYNDHAHPEYCTPECAGPDDLVAQDLAGERWVQDGARRLSEETGRRVRLYKNNTDFHGHAYGCHENYLLPRSLAWDDLCAGIEAFLVTRQVFCGAGKFGVEDEDRFLGPGFQLSQRADFVRVRQSVDTMQERPLINTRDEPHADPARWRRFHVILGDANRSPFATRLKAGTTALVLEALVRDPALARRLPRLADPVGAVRDVSRDAGRRWEVVDAEGRPTTALEIQRAYLDAVRSRVDPATSPWAAVLGDWQEVLDDLATDPERCADRLDWVQKHRLIRAFQESEGLSDEDPWLRSLDLAYAALDPEDDLFAGVVASGAMRPGVSESAVERAATHPPTGTRAAVRGACVERFGDDVLAVQWDHVLLRTPKGPFRVDLTRLFDPAEVERACERIRSAENPARLAETWGR